MIREFRLDLTSVGGQGDQEPVCAARREVVALDRDWMSSSDEGARVISSGRERRPALGGKFTAVRVGAQNLVDAPPCPLVLTPSQPPKLARPGSVQVARPRAWGGGEGGKGQVGENGGEVQPGACPIRSPRGEIRPGAEVEIAKKAEEFVIVQACQAEGERSEEGVRSGAERGSKPERRIGAQGAKTTAPYRR